jgi:predicted nucleotidyltransferase
MKERKALLKGLKDRYAQEGVVLLGIFGSRARNTHQRSSDLDLAYTLDYPLFDRLYRGGLAKVALLEEIKEEPKGIVAIRNYIAHDYDSIDDHIIEEVIRGDLPRIYLQRQELLKSLHEEKT